MLKTRHEPGQLNGTIFYVKNVKAVEAFLYIQKNSNLLSDMQKL